MLADQPNCGAFSGVGRHLLRLCLYTLSSAPQEGCRSAASILCSGTAFQNSPSARQQGCNQIQWTVVGKLTLEPDECKPSLHSLPASLLSTAAACVCSGITADAAAGSFTLLRLTSFQPSAVPSMITTVAVLPLHGQHRSAECSKASLQLLCHVGMSMQIRLESRSEPGRTKVVMPFGFFSVCIQQLC